MPGTESRRTTMLVALALTFLPLAFSDDIVEAAIENTSVPFDILLPVDLLFLVVLITISYNVHGRVQGRRAYWSWLVVLALTVALDAILIKHRGEHSLGIDGLLIAGYTVAQLIALAAVVQASPAQLVSGRARRADPQAWSRLRGGLPIIFGTFAAYLSGTYWDRSLNPGAQRTWEAAAGVYAERLRLPVDQVLASQDPAVWQMVATFCGGGVDQEYFAQTSQIIPLLLIAIGVDAKFFLRFKDSTGRAMIIIAVVALCLAEAIAISTLALSNGQCGNILDEWHEYVAFEATISACAIGLATLAWALLTRGEIRGEAWQPLRPRRAPVRRLTVQRQTAPDKSVDARSEDL